MTLPGWDSLESVKTLNFSFHIAALVFIALLAGAEIMAFVYGERRDTLIEISDRAAATKRTEDQQQADARHAAEIGGLKGQLSEAEKKVVALQGQNIARRLLDTDKAALIKDLSNSPGQKATVFCNTVAWDCSDYAKDFLAVFKAAKWDVPDAPSYGIVVGGTLQALRLSSIRGSFPSQLRFPATLRTRSTIWRFT